MTAANIDLKKIGRTGSLILLFGVLVFIFHGYSKGSFSSTEAFEGYIRGFGLSAPIIFTMVQALQVVIPILPGFIGCAAGAVVFGSAGGFLCNYIGISAGSILAFWLAKKYGTTFVKNVISESKYEKYTDWISKRKCFTIVLFLTILLPLAPDDMFCYLSGLTKMSLKKFTWIILLGKPWLILFYSLFFSGLL